MAISENNQSLEEILFDLAVQKPDAAERAAFLDNVCHDNPDLRTQLDELLEGHFGRAGFLPKPTAREPLPVTVRVIPDDEAPAQMLGRYKLLEQIGEGGFGEVWMAEQREPVKRRVALKIIKLGMDIRQIVARFEGERQALAMMDHANIAKIFDASVTDTGRPYFVMELVRGIKITEYCDQNQLRTKERLDLFIKVCQAIQHAHQKGIIHRDIKPSNILVTLHDGVPVPKVIDFGIAKATQGELTDKTVFTQFQQFIGTPAYISPEQAEMSGLDIDTRADIYSLGVLLYELLVGQTPFDAKEMMQGGIDALRQIIREREPLRPSTRLTQELVAADVSRRKSTQGLAVPTQEEVSADSRRRLRLKEQITVVRGDLDWIVMKCLEKDRTRRYDTANGLAMDIQHHLVKEPVVARPPSAVYKFQKAWQRNKLAFTAGATVAAALVVGIGVSLWQAILATKARDFAKKANVAEIGHRRAAEAERERAEAGARALRKSLYTADMKLAQVALEERNRGQAPKLVEKYAHRTGGSPAPPNPSSDFKSDASQSRESEDVRGWEWRYLWRLTRGDELAILQGHQNRVLSVAFSPKGKLLLSGSTDRTARLWDVDAQRELRSFTFTNAVEAVAFSPDGKQFAIASGDTVAMGHVETLAPPRPLFAHAETVHSLAFSGDGKTLASGSTFVKLWDLASAQTIDTLDASVGAVLSVAFSADGRLLAAGDDEYIKSWDLAYGRGLTKLNSHANVFKNGFNSVAFSPTDGTLASASYDGSVKLWNPVSPQALATFNGPGPNCWTVRFSPEGKRLAAGFSDQTIKLWDVASRQQIATLKGHAKEVLTLAFSPDGKVLASGSKNGTIRLWNPDVRPVEVGYTKLADSIGLPVVSSDAKTILTFNGTNSVSLWDPRSAREPSRFSLPPDVVSIAVHPGGDLLALAKRDGALSLWNTSVSNERSLDGHTRGDGGLAFSPDGKQLVRAGVDGTAMFFDVESGRETGSIQASPRAFGWLWYSPDSRLLAATSGSDWTVSLWDIASRKKVATLQGHKEDVVGLAFSSDGKLLATASYDGSARLWEVATGRPIGAPITGPFLALYSVRFSPDGKRLAAGTADGRVVIWDTDTLTEVVTLKGHGSDLGVWGVFFLDQDTLVSMRRNEVFVWRAAPLAETDAIQGTGVK